MDPDLFLQDVLAEPETLAGVLDAYAGDGSPLRALGADPLAGRRVALIGMGSSRFAAIPVAAALRARGVAAVAEYASAQEITAPGPDVLAIGISATGTTPETVEALERHRGISRTVAITNCPDGPLAAAADVVLPMHAGEERGGVACRTFQATVAILRLLAGADPARLARAVDAQRALLDARGDWLEPLLATLAPVHTVYAVAPAERLSSALQSALMFREGPRVAADAAETGDWLHVDVYLSKHPGYTALVFGGSRFDAGLMEWARERASTIVAIGPAVDGAALHLPFAHAGDPLVASLVEVSIAELAAATWWRRRLDADAMP
ncbi:MAG TPA: SIS domain-containing protein [Capillimicrobium sp.]|nr:SIS domain-containing protein [Capillimicrobium sp.]